MTLPAPNLDDRRFQQLVDEAKLMVQTRCPRWTDHNVSDPGVTLIETFAYMVDQLIYRVNRVPDRMYLKFLDLLGVRLFPPTSATTDVTFWLSAPQSVDVAIPTGTEVATVRTETEDAVTFTITKDLVIPPVELIRLASSVNPPQIRDHTDTFSLGVGFDAFDVDPKDGDALFLGLSRPAPSCVLLLRFDCEVRGLGVDPNNAPIVWQAWNGAEWVDCDVFKDTTGGLNKVGDVLLQLPHSQVLSTIGQHTAAWLRCLVSEKEGQRGYSASPRINRLVVAAMGGTTRATNAELIENEMLGISNGVPGQRFQVKGSPIVPADKAPVVEVISETETTRWSEVSTFASSAATDRHFILEEDTGWVVFGPAVREKDGSMRQYGAVPPSGSTVRILSYRTGGGRNGNVTKGAISVLKSSIPYIASVENRTLGTGGVDAEDISAVRSRGPMVLRSRDRAVTPEDYEYLVREIAPDIARVKCIPVSRTSTGAVRVMIVPAVQSADPSQLTIEELTPLEETMSRIDQHLESRRIIGVRVAIDRPEYKGLTVVTRLKSSWRANPEAVRTAATAALYRYLHPVIGGPDGSGWIFGRPVNVSEIQAVLDNVAETDVISEVLLFPVDLATRTRAERPVTRFPVAIDELPLSFRHQVFVDGT